MVPPSVQRIDKFDVLRRLGRGGMGSVYLARDPDMDRLVAIKLLHEGFDDEELRGRFSTEARSASALRHANIVTIFQTGTFLERPFIVMEYVAGETFSDIVASGGSVPMATRLQFLDQLLAGLQYAHAKGIVHRDIKPANVMVDSEGVVRILDFGIARLGDGGLTRTGVVLGTLSYMSPEQLAGQPVDARADIFCAGLVGYELVSSTRAFPQEFPEVLRQIGFQDPPPLEDACPGIDPALVRIINRCLAKRAEDRYSDCAAIRRDLDAVRRTIDEARAVTEAPDEAAPTLLAGAPTPSSVLRKELESDTLRIVARPPTDRPAAPAQQAEPDARPTVVMSRPPTASTGPMPAPVRQPNPRGRRRSLAIAGAAVVLVAIAAGVWRMTASRSQSIGSTSESAERAGVPASQPPATNASPAGVPPAAVGAPVPAAPAAPPPVAAPRAGAPVTSPLATAKPPAAPARGRGRAPAPAPLRVGGAIEIPKQVRRVNPEYPSMARSARLQGTVILEATIGTSGKVTDVRVIRSIALLDNAAVEAVRQWEYEPTVVNGVAVPVISSIAVEFKLEAPKPVRVGGTVKQPAQTKRVSPPYPPEAQAAGVQGVVILEATVGPDGKVTDVRVLRSIPLLDQAALEAVRQWEYAPTLIDGVAVPVIMTVTVNFTLTPPAEAPK